MLATTLWVALGGAIGSMARFWLALAVGALTGPAFPWGTLLINVLGSFVIVFFGTLTGRAGLWDAPPDLRVFVMVGICGGFTTFSSFSLQTLELLQAGEIGRALGYAVGSVLLCLVGAWLGFTAAHGMATPLAAAAPPARTVLAVLTRLHGAPSCLAAAAMAAQVMEAPTLIALHVRPAPALPTEEIAPADDADATALRRLVATWRQPGLAVPVLREPADAGAEEVARAGRRTALLVLTLPGAVPSPAHAEAVNAALFNTGRPVLLVPADVPEIPPAYRHVMIAWQESAAARRAVAAAAPWIARARRVTAIEVVRCAGSAASSVPGLPVPLERVAAAGRGEGEAILAEAVRRGADCLVMGAFRHTRMREALLGGTTRTVLQTGTLPVLMQH